MVDVVAFGRGIWSHPNFLKARASQLKLLKDELGSLRLLKISDTDGNGGGYPLLRESQTFNVYVGPHAGPESCPDSDVIWVSSSPVNFRPSYPIVLDILEAVRRVSPTPLAEAACAAIAPTWEMLAEYGLTTENRGPRWDDVQGADNLIRENFLLAAAAQVTAALGPRFGVVLRAVSVYDDSSINFVVRLLREARLTGLHIAVQAPITALETGPLAAALEGASISLRSSDQFRPPAVVDDFGPEARRILALSNNGVPRRVLRAMTQSMNAMRQLHSPAELQDWGYVDEASARRIRAGLSTEERHRILCATFDSWPPDGWGYLRRYSLAVSARNHDRLLMQHTAQAYGLADIGQTFRYRHFSVLASILPERQDNVAERVYAWVGAARLGSRSREIRERNSALTHYRRAFDLAIIPAIKGDISCAIGSLHAKQPGSDSLRHAEVWYEQAERLQSVIGSAADRAYVHIRVLNGLALVRYRQGEHHKALELELRAQEIAESVRISCPDVTAWAMPTIRSNMARVLEAGLGDIESAVELLRQNLSAQAAHHRVSARYELARVFFDRHDYQDVIGMLAPLCESAASDEEDEQRELFYLLVHALSLTALGVTGKVRLVLPRIAYLLHVVGTPGAHGLLAALRRIETSDQPAPSGHAL